MIPRIMALLPTRDRLELLERSIKSLVNFADEPGQVCILLGLDPDDYQDHMAAYNWLVAAYAPHVALMVMPERFGYARLHEYINRLAAAAPEGDWLMLWNDDAVMMTAGWDEAVMDQDPGVLWPEANHCLDGNIFPIWPQAWTRKIGHVSLSCNVDVWIGDLGRATGTQRRVPVFVFHDRYDVTGQNDDRTYREGRAAHFHADVNEPGYDSEANLQARADEADIVRELIREAS